MSLHDFAATRAGRAISAILTEPGTIAEMESLAGLGVPPVKAVDAVLPVEMRLTNTEKQYVGRMVRDVLADRNWRVGGQRRFDGGRQFVSGSWYRRAPGRRRQDVAEPADGPRPPLPHPDGSFLQRMDEARARVRRFSMNDYGVDDFVRDRRAEAARENGDGSR